MAYPPRVHTGYVDGVLGPLILTGIGLGMVIAPSINTGTFGVMPRDAGVASASVTVGQQLGASIGTSLLNTILALVHGYDTAFWWTAGIFAVGAIICGTLLRRGPLYAKDTPAPRLAGARSAETEAGRSVSA